MSNNDDYDFLFKCVLVGDSHVGKTQILSRYIDNYFVEDSKPTVGVEFATKTITVDNKSIKNQIWDTAGQQRFRALACVYYRGAVGAIVVFDLSKYKTFQSSQKWIRQVKQYSEPQVTILLVGNKNDLQQHQVKQEDIQKFAIKNKLIYISTSAATGQNIDLAFSILSKEIIKKTTSVNDEDQQLVLIDMQSQAEDKKSRMTSDIRQKYIIKTPNKNQKFQIKQEKHQNLNTTQNSTQKDSTFKKQKPKMQAFQVEDNSKVKLRKQQDKSFKPKSKCC